MKSYYSFLIISIMLICSTPSSSFGDIITKDGVKIQVFERGSKKSIPKSDLTSTSENPLYMEVDVGVDKLVFSGKNYDFTDDNLFTVKVYNEENNDVLLKKEKFHIFFDKKNKSYTFPIYPWISEIGKYKIVIERDYENILEFTFELFIQEGC
jgi:hypothetical protein